MVQLMLPGRSRTICMIYHVVPAVALYSIYTGPAQHLKTADTGSAIDDLDDLDDL